MACTGASVVGELSAAGASEDASGGCSDGSGAAVGCLGRKAGAGMKV